MSGASALGCSMTRVSRVGLAQFQNMLDIPLLQRNNWFSYDYSLPGGWFSGSYDAVRDWYDKIHVTEPLVQLQQSNLPFPYTVDSTTFRWAIYTKTGDSFVSGSSTWNGKSMALFRRARNIGTPVGGGIGTNDCYFVADSNTGADVSNFLYDSNQYTVLVVMQRQGPTDAFGEFPNYPIDTTSTDHLIDKGANGPVYLGWGKTGLASAMFGYGDQSSAGAFDNLVLSSSLTQPFIFGAAVNKTIHSASFFCANSGSTDLKTGSWTGPNFLSENFIVGSMNSNRNSTGNRNVPGRGAAAIMDIMVFSGSWTAANYSYYKAWALAKFGPLSSSQVPIP